MDNHEERKKEIRKPYLWEALLTFSVLVLFLAVGIKVFETDPHVPMLLGTAAAALMALRLGFTWTEIETSMKDGIYQAMQSMIILAIIGVLIGVWIDSGVVPTMIYYGLKIIHPAIFLIATVLICSITSLATGTSWGTVGTMGVALMGIAIGLGIPPAATAGAVMSGAYFGDKMSPLSDTTNLAPAMAGTDVFTHVKFMILPTAITYAMTIVFFGVLGARYYHGNTVDMSAITQISDSLSQNFTISPILLLPPIIVIVCVAKKMPAIPGIFIGILAGGILGLIFKNSNLGTLLETGMNGYVSETGIVDVDNLLSKGGLMNMMFSISMTMIAMMFGGIMEKTKQLEVIVDELKGLAKSPASLVVLTEITCVFSNATMPEQYISLVVPGRMYADEYKKRGLHPKTLSNALESAGTVSGAMIPWNTCGVFMRQTLGVTVSQYLPFLFFNLAMPIVVAIMAFMGLTVAAADGTRLYKKKKMERDGSF